MSDKRKGMRVGLLQVIPFHLFYNLLGSAFFINAYLLYLGASPKQLGIIFGIPAFVSMSLIFVAILIQKVTNKILFFLSFFCIYIVATLLTWPISIVLPSDWWVYSYMILYLIACLNFSTGGMIFVSYMTDLIPNKLRGRYFGIRHSLSTAMGIVALLLSTVILKYTSQNIGFSVIFILAFVCAIFAVVCFWLYPKAPFEKSKELSTLHMIYKPFKDKRFLNFTIIATVWVLFQSISIPFFNFAMLDIF